jgi:hypothetical protein
MPLTSPRFQNDSQLQAASRNSPALSRGSRGTGVAALQQALFELGYAMPNSTKTSGAMDGIYGNETLSVVQSFQRDQSSFAQSKFGQGLTDDGIAGRHTLETLDAVFNLPAGQRPGDPAPPPPADQSPRPSVDVPLAIEPRRLASLRLDPTLRCRLNSVWGEVKAGETWLGPEGKRFILTATNPLIFYMSYTTGKVYVQSTRGFLDDVNAFVFNEVGRKGELIVTLAEFECGFAAGIAAALYTPAFVAVLASEAFGFYAENRKEFPRWRRILAASVDADDTLATYAPTLRRKVYYVLFIDFLKDIAPYGIPSGAKHPDKVGFWLGVLVATLGKKIYERRLVSWKTLLFLVEQVILRTLQGLPSAAKDFEAKLKQSPDQILETIQAAGGTLTPEDIRAIHTEVTSHPRELLEAVKMVVEAAQ